MKNPLKNTEPLKLEMIREKLIDSTPLDAMHLAKELFYLNDDEVTCISKKCQFETYMHGYALQVSPRRILYICSSQIGLMCEILRTTSQGIEQYEYDARALWFNLEKRTTPTAYSTLITQ